MQSFTQLRPLSRLRMGRMHIFLICIQGPKNRKVVFATCVGIAFESLDDLFWIKKYIEEFKC